MSQGVGSIDLNAAEEACDVTVQDGVDGEAERHCAGKAHSCAMPCRAVKHGTTEQMKDAGSTSLGVGLKC